MGALHAARNWTNVGSRAVVLGTISLTVGAIPDKDQRVRRWCMRRWGASSCKALGIHAELFNQASIDDAPQCVFIANHLSTLDILVLGQFIKQDYRWLAKAELFKVPFMGWHLSAAGHVPVYRGELRDRNSGIVERIHAVVEEGASLLFFPEGTRSDDGHLKAFKIGAFMTAVTEGLPVVPLVIRGTHELMVKGARDVANKGDKNCSVTALAPIHAPPGGDEKTRARALRAAAYAAFARDLYPDAEVLPGQEAAEADEPTASPRSERL